jgi:hypothetical protein
MVHTGSLLMAALTFTLLFAALMGFTLHPAAA